MKHNLDTPRRGGLSRRGGSVCGIAHTQRRVPPLPSSLPPLASPNRSIPHAPSRGPRAASPGPVGYPSRMTSSATSAHYTWDDFVALEEDDLRELIDGELVEVEVPTFDHEKNRLAARILPARVDRGGSTAGGCVAPATRSASRIDARRHARPAVLSAGNDARGRSEAGPRPRARRSRRRSRLRLPAAATIA